MNEFSIVISTYNRLEELKVTLSSLSELINHSAKLIICDDASTDGTYEWLKLNYPNIELYRNLKNQGLIHNRNFLLNKVNTTYAISLDDDSNFLGTNPLEKIKDYFKQNNKCAVISFRIYWNLEKPSSLKSNEKASIVKSFVGCGHVWKMKAWKDIPNYPSWFRFYGEENFASLQLFKKNWEIHYLPFVLVHHRVNNKARKLDKDYYIRAKRSLRADWFNYFIFYPKEKIFLKVIYSLWKQLTNKVFKGKDWRFLIVNIYALIDIWKYRNSIHHSRTPLTKHEYDLWLNIKDTKIYWEPDEK